MKLLLKQARIICASSPHHKQVKDLLIVDGKIASIASQIDDDNAEVIKSDHLHVSIGWMDTFARFGEPGFEYRETIASGASAAASGGFTDVMLLPNTQPSISNKSMVEFILQRSAVLPVNILPIGAATQQTEGRSLCEMYDMYNSGAVAFSDGHNSIQDPAIMIKALQYLKAINATLIQLPNQKSISAHGLMHEGITSTRLGLPGIPAIAEELMIARDIELLRYTNSRLHITGVSTANGIERIKAAKKEGLQITCSVTPYHLHFCDEDLQTYTTDLKTDPPLRSKTDREALRKALLEGEIDCLASHHQPLHIDEKNCEFEYAKHGMETLEAAYSAYNSLDMPIALLIDMLVTKPRKIFGLHMPSIEEGTNACLTCFDPNHSFHVDASMIRSSSKNNAFLGKTLKGKVIGIINKGQFVSA
jgi:dihydroorotase